MKNFRSSTKLLMGAAIAMAMSVSMTSCDDDETDPPIVPPTSTGATKLIGLDISTNTTWSKDTVYVLTSRIKVRPGATLTINPGTIIKGSEGQESNAKVLMVMRGGKIMAEGTAAEPIIFTSILDQIQPGQIQSPNLPSDLTGQWGGLAILGNAVIAAKQQDPTGSFDENQIEGVPTSDLDGRYGGTNNADNSGVLRYVSVRHGGTSIGSGNELNGISFGGVGSGTVVENIEIVGNADDGLEFYGGTVNATNVVVWNNGDDALDTDNGYTGTIDNIFIVGPAGSPFELDGPEGSTTTISSNHIIRNATVVASRPDGFTNAGDLINYDDNTNVTIENIHFTNVVSGQIINPNDVAAGPTVITNITIDVPAGDIPSYVSTANPAILNEVSAGSTGKANSAPFSGWSWASVSGGLSGL